MTLSEKLKQYVNRPHGMNMGTRDASLKPEYARVLGARLVDDQHIHVFLDRKSAGRTFQNLENNQQMCVVMASLENFESFQFKGRSVNWHESNEEESRLIDEYLEGMNTGLNRMGFQDRLVYNYPHSSMMTLLMEVEEVYEQTPKSGTGKKVML